MLKATISALLLSSFLDTFLVSGYFFYGTAVAVSATGAMAIGLHPFIIIAAVLLGSLAGEFLNFNISRLVGLSQFVKDKVTAINNRKYIGQLLYKDDDTYFVQLFKFLYLRFVAISRPINVILYTSIHRISLKSISIIIISNSIWSVFWTYFFFKLKVYIVLLLDLF